MKIVDMAIKIICNKDELNNPKKVIKSIEKKKKEKKYKLPAIKFKSNVIKESIDNFDIYKLYNSDSNIIILYLHGGCYINEAVSFHYRFVDKICDKYNIDIYFPVYPLLPNYKYKDAYNFLIKLYSKLLEKNKKIIIMGDSAGGGLALGFSLYLKEIGYKLPDKLVLISPWVDVTLKNKEIQKYEKKDPMLSSYGPIEYAKIWAGNTNLNNYKLSPINGDLKGLPDILLFTGTNEILYPDLKLLYRKLQKNNVNCDLIIGKELTHDYPLYIKKNESIKKIIDFISN